MAQHEIPDVPVWAAVLDQLTVDDRVTPQLHGFLNLAVPQGVMSGTLYLDVPNDLTAAQINKRMRAPIMEALSRVPGVVAQSRYGTSDIRLMIRGFGARGAGDRSNSGTTRGVRVLIDGFPETEPDGRTSLDQLDLAAAEGIEVIRSNASSADVANTQRPFIETDHFLGPDRRFRDVAPPDGRLKRETDDAAEQPK